MMAEKAFCDCERPETRAVAEGRLMGYHCKKCTLQLNPKPPEKRNESQTDEDQMKNQTVKHKPRLPPFLEIQIG